MRPRDDIGSRYRWYRAKLLRRVCDFDPLGNLLVCGGPRSGSTWLAELIATMPRTALLFEPLTPTEPGPFRELGFAWDQPIPEEAEWPEAALAFESMLRGKAISNWNITYSRSSAAAFLTARRMVVKCCHANALLPWLARQFAFRYTPIFLLRHPFAVVASQLKHGNWSGQPSAFKIPDCRFNKFYKRHEPFLSRLQTREEALTAQWCLSNGVPLNSKHFDMEWITVHYESLLMHPERELRRIFDRWQLPLPTNVTNRVVKPSRTTVEATFNRDIDAQLSKWRIQFSSRQLGRMLAVLDYFDVTVYGSDPLPVSNEPNRPRFQVK